MSNDTWATCLYEELSPFLEKKGYRTLLIDFKEMKSTCGYNPMDYLPYDRNRKCYSEEGIRRLSVVLAPAGTFDRDPFWNNASRQYLECLIAYVMECLPPQERLVAAYRRGISEVEQVVIAVDNGRQFFDKVKRWEMGQQSQDEEIEIFGWKEKRKC